MFALLFSLLLLGTGTASPVQPRTLDPTVKNATLYGIIAQYEPNYLDRDSCGTTAWGDRVLFVCRDTEIYVDRENTTKGVAAFFSSSASYIDKNADGSLPFEPYNSSSYGDYGYEQGFIYRLPTYGNNKNTSFYPLQADEDPESNGGNSTTSTRFVIWPDTPPLISKNTSCTDSSDNGKIKAYTWIKKAEITDSLGVVIPFPATSLYRLDYDPSVQGHDDTLPSVSIVQEEFFKENQWNYGTYGSVLGHGDGYAYLYGQPLSTPNVSLARVPIGSEEDIASYSYYVSGEWTSALPSLNDSASWLPETFGAQGTFYYSELWQSFVWLGQAQNSASFDVYVSTAPDPQGPWTGPKLIFSDKTNFPGFKYTIQANPAFLSSPEENAMWVSYTQAINGYGYNTILYKFDWE